MSPLVYNYFLWAKDPGQELTTKDSTGVQVAVARIVCRICSNMCMTGFNYLDSRFHIQVDKLSPTLRTLTGGFPLTLPFWCQGMVVVILAICQLVAEYLEYRHGQKLTYNLNFIFHK